MNYTVIIIEAVALVAAFTAIIMIPLIKNPVWWIHDYPKDIQEEYFKTHERVPSEFFSATVLIKKGIALLIALAILVCLIWLAEAKNFTQAFIVSYGLWTLIDWYDCFVLDWIFFANLKSVRLPGTENMDKAYHQKSYHLIRSLYGMLIGLIPCLVGSGVYAMVLLFF